MKVLHGDITPIFGIDVSTNKNNTTLNGAEFISRTTSTQKIEELDYKQENLDKTIEKSKLPLWVQIVELLCGGFSLIVFFCSIPVGFKTAFKNAPSLVIISIFSALVWAVLFFVSKKKEKKLLNDDNANSQFEAIDQDLSLIYNELGVPADAVEIDFLTFKYKVKNGVVRPYASGFQATPYINVMLKTYATSEELHIVDVENVYSFKKSDIKSIIIVNKRISVPFWTKDEGYNKGEFKQYKMTINNLGNISFKPYYILEIEKDNQKFGIYFPCYELSAIENLTGLKAFVE